MRRKIFICLLVVLLMSSAQISWAMIFSNGDFESGDLSNYFQQEDFGDVSSSPLISVVDDGTGNHVGEIKTGFTSDNIFTATLGRDIGTLPSTSTDLSFDFKILDDGPDQGGGSPFLDALTISLLTDSGDLNPILTADLNGSTIIEPSLTSLHLLPDGFYHVNTNIAGLSGAPKSQLFFDFSDADDARLSKAWIDNVDITLSSSTVPEPATMILFGSGLFGLFGFNRRKHS